MKRGWKRREVKDGEAGCRVAHYREYGPGVENLLEIIEPAENECWMRREDVSSSRRLSAADVCRQGKYFIQDVAPYCLGIVSGSSGLVTDEDNYDGKNRGAMARETKRGYEQKVS